MGDDIRINANSDTLVAAVNKAIQAWKDYIRLEDAAVTATLTFNKAGEQQIRVTAKQADEQRKLNIVMQQAGTDYKTVSASLTEATVKSVAYQQSLRQLAAVQADFNRQAQAVGKYVQRGVSFIGADPAAILRYKNEVGKLKELIQQQVGSLKNVKTAWTGLNGVTDAYSGNMRRIRNQVAAVRRAEEQLKAPLQDANKQIRTMNISWQSMIRLVGLQLARQAVSALTRAIADGVRQAIELEKRIAEVRTISQESQLPFQRWRDELVALSNAFGIPVLDQVEATYQTLSNQVAEGAETFAFLEEANKLALASVSSTSEAVNLLTAAINAYQLDVSDAERVAASFFKTVELGRVRIADMATSFGDVAVLARQLNIPLTDLQALIDTLTIQGIAYNKSNTQLRGIFVKLLKPTQDMKELFEELGVASGEDAIRIYGLLGFLRKLNEVTEGSSTKIAKYISRIRGLSGILAIVNKDAELFVRNQEQIKNSTASYVQAQALVLEASGKKLEIELTKIKNFFLVELGDTILQFIAESTNGFEGLTDVVKGFTQAILLVLIPALTALTVKLAVLAVTNPFSAAIVGATALIGLIRTIQISAEEAAEAERKAFENAAKQRVEDEKRASQQITTDFEEELTARILRVERFAATVFGEFARLRRDTVKDTKDFGRDLTNINKDVTKTLTEGIRQARKEFKEFSRLAEQLREETTDVFREAGRFLFEVQIEDQGFEGKIREIQNRIEQLREASVFALALEDKEAFDELRQEILDLAKQDREIRREAQDENRDNAAERIKLEEQVAKENQQYARRRLDLHLKLIDQLNNERKNQDAIHKIRLQMNRLVEDHEAKIKRIQEAEKKLVDNSVTQINFQERYLELIAEEAQQRTAWAESAEKLAAEAHQREIDLVLQKIQLEEAYRKFQDFNLKEVLKLTDAAAAKEALEARRQTTRELFNALQEIGVSEEAQARLRIRNINEERVLRERIFELEKRAALENLKAESEVIKTRFEAIRQGIEAEQVELVQLDNRFEAIRRAIQKGLAGERELFKGTAPSLGSAGTFEAAQIEKLRQTLLPIEQVLAEFAEVPAVENIDEVVSALSKLRSSIRVVPIGNYSRLSQELNIQTEKLRENITAVVIELLDQKDAQEDLIQKSERLADQEQQLRNLTIELLKSRIAANESLKEGAEVEETAAGTIESYDTKVKDLTQSLRNLEIQLDKVREAMMFQNIQVPAVAEEVGFAKGGSLHGRDTVPALLSPGEFVVNAAATRRFYSQLVRMNSGVQTFDRGGQVTNVNVGDVNVNLPSTTSPDYDAVRLGKILRRGIRRGTIAL